MLPGLVGAKKNGAPQLSCNNNFAEAINEILPPEKNLKSKTAPLKECPLWLKIRTTGNPTSITTYFEMCR